ncbi:MAG TPA: AI-2E family transporter, partial [Bacillota bacterium]|nr:AI-2E family transporter [Bacillota bacterium]
MWYHDKFFRYSAAIILILIIIFFLGQIDFFWGLIGKITGILFIPILFSGFFYYLFRPLLRLAEKIRIPTTIAILLLFLLFTGIGALLVFYVGAVAGRQTLQFLNHLPGLIDQAKAGGEGLLKGRVLGAMFTGKIQAQLAPALGRAAWYLKEGFLRTFAGITRVTGLLITIPFILFYLLRDHKKFSRSLFRRFPQSYRGEVRIMMEDSDEILSGYITGQALLALLQGVLMYVGFLIVGLPYGLILALLIVLTSFIPMFGLLIGIIPAILVGFTEGSWMVLKVLGLLVIVNSLRKLIAPFLIGDRLELHPLTIIAVFLIAGSLFGFSGVLIAVPVYAVLKVIGRGAVRIYRIRKAQAS